MDRRARLRARIDRNVVALANRVSELESIAGDVRERVSEVLSIDHHIRQRPMSSLAAAVGAGLVMGAVFGAFRS